MKILWIFYCGVRTVRRRHYLAFRNGNKKRSSSLKVLPDCIRNNVYTRAGRYTSRVQSLSAAYMSKVAEKIAKIISRAKFRSLSFSHARLIWDFWRRILVIYAFFGAVSTNKSFATRICRAYTRNCAPWENGKPGALKSSLGSLSRKLLD